MSQMIINKTLRPAQQAHFMGKGFIGLYGDKANSFSRMGTHFAELARGMFHSVDERLHGKEWVASTIQAGGVIRGCIVKVGIARVGVYVYQTPDAQDNLLQMLTMCNGNNSEDFVKLYTHFQGVPAMNLYEWEGSHFGVNDSILETLNLLKFSTEIAKSKMDNTNSALLDISQTMDLLRVMCADYKVFNLNVEKMKCVQPQRGEDEIRWISLADAGRLDAEGWNERGNEFSIRVTELMYLHTIIHEFAHIVNFVQDGWSGHGNRFREVYEELLRKYGGKMNANVSVPRI